MIISFSRKLILLSSFSFIGTNLLPAFAELDNQSSTQTSYDGSNSKAPWKINPQHWPPEAFCPTSPYHHIESTRNFKDSHNIIGTMPLTAPSDSIDISIRTIEIKEI